MLHIFEEPSAEGLVVEGDRIPAWALTYEAGRFAPWSLTVDIIGMAVDLEQQDLHTMVIVRGQAGPYQGEEAWPGGFVHWENDRSAQAAALRELHEETGQLDPEYLEELRTYDEYGRDPRQFSGRPDPETGEWIRTGTRVASKAFLALLRGGGRHLAPIPDTDAVASRWASVYDHLPWEDLRSEASLATRNRVTRDLRRWADSASGTRACDERHERIERHFTIEGWNEEEVPERWALLVEAKLVTEAWRDRWGRAVHGAPRLLYGRMLAFDHRTMLADALGRLRERVKSRPEVVRALVEPPFKLSELQVAYETIAGRLLYHSNFRRVMASSRAFVEQLGTWEQPQGPGKPAQLYSFSASAQRQRLDPPLNLPWRPVGLDR